MQAVFAEWLGSRPLLARSWIKSLGHDSHKPGRVILVPSAAASSAAGEGEEQGLVSLAEVAFCLGEGGEDSAASPFSLCSLRDQVRERERKSRAFQRRRLTQGGREFSHEAY